jgi:macrolide-specific efflux system membrane fusion protein
MNKRRLKFLIFIPLVLIVGLFLFFKLGTRPDKNEIVEEIKLSLGYIETVISTTGTVYPKNRLEIMPPVAGRVENVLVREGEYVKAGQILAWMSSTERAALLDAARGQGEDKLKYWQEAYKPIALLAPIDGQVIVATTQPGQTVNTSDAVVVLSDQLIVRAQVDETDIGRIKLGQKATIGLDAYPDTFINAVVGHIYYESETSNNVTIYKVDLLPDEIPLFFRSGMNATVNFKVENKDNVLLIPVNAVRKENQESYVLLKQEGNKDPAKRIVNLGMTDDKNYEVLSGVTSKDVVIITTKKYIFPGGGKTGSNPFLPKMPGAKKKTAEGPL